METSPFPIDLKDMIAHRREILRAQGVRNRNKIIRELRLEWLVRAMREAGGNAAKAAKMLGYGDGKQVLGSPKPFCRRKYFESQGIQLISHGGAANRVKTHCKRGHELTPENVRVHPVRKSDPRWRPTWKPGRQCKACLRNKKKLQNERRRARNAQGAIA